MECNDEAGEDVCDLDCDTLKVIDNPKSCSSNSDDPRRKVRMNELRGFLLD